MEIDCRRVRPATTRPPSTPPGRATRRSYPVAWGALTHEAAHAAHSIWVTPPPAAPEPPGQAAQMLEESRAERAHLSRRPGTAVSAEPPSRPGHGDFTTQTPTDRWQAAYAAGLILARRDAGILDPDETEPLEQTVRASSARTSWAPSPGSGPPPTPPPTRTSRRCSSTPRPGAQALGAAPEQPATSPGPPSQAYGELAEAIGKVAGHGDRGRGRGRAGGGRH